MQKLENNSKAVCKLRAAREKREPFSLTKPFYFVSCPQYLTCVLTSPHLTHEATQQESGIIVSVTYLRKIGSKLTFKLKSYDSTTKSLDYTLIIHLKVDFGF